MISKDEVQHIAKLARMELTEQEVEKMQIDLSSVLDYFDLLKKANTRDYAEFARLPPVGRERRGNVKNATREDEVADKPASLANNLIAAAPNRKDEYIKVKTIL